MLPTRCGGSLIANCGTSRTTPGCVLQTVSRDRIERVLADPVFRKNVAGFVQNRRQALETPAWFQLHHSQGPLTCAAYFSMEFMLSEALPIYSGGLGNVAGDQLKAASDLDVPVVGVGLLYQQGYFADHHMFEVEIFLNDLDPNAARVELYADGIDGGDPVREEMKCARPLPGASRPCVYQATVPAARPAGDYTARVMPQRSGVAVPLESARILWQR